MELLELRFSGGREDTLGLMFDVTAMMDNIGQFIPGNAKLAKWLCFSLEDEFRISKVRGETRIPAGRYKIELRKEGRLNIKYLDRFEDMHRGMLWLREVPNFEWIYLHTGNKEVHTDGCPLVGNTCQQNITDDGFVGASADAYRRIYPPIAQAIEGGENVYITIKDEDFVALTLFGHLSSN